MKRKSLPRTRRKFNIDGLPDEILVYILSRLNVKQAVSTSIISKRWRYVWTLLPRLDFRSSPKSKQEMGDDAIVMASPNAYLNMVNRVLGRHRGGSALNEFRVRYRLDETQSSNIDSWVQFAMSSRVSSLELNFQNPADPLYCSTGEPSLGEGEQNSKNYSLQPFLFDKPKGYCFNHLKELVLKSVDVTDELFYTMLVKCSSLEKLLLLRAFKLVNARCDHRLPCLKLLEIYWCDELQDLEILAPNLAGFHFQGRGANIRLEDAPQLSELSLFTLETPLGLVGYSGMNIHREGNSSFLHQFAPYFSQLVHLEMEIKSFEGRDDLYDVVPHFCNLKRLSVFVADWNWTSYAFLAVASLMKASPALLRMELHLPAHFIVKEEDRSFPKFKHQNLNSVLISGYNHDQNHLEFVKFVYECAIALEKMEMTPDLVARVTGANERRSYSTSSNVSYRRRSELMTGLPRRAKLEVYTAIERHGCHALGWRLRSFPVRGIRVVV